MRRVNPRGHLVKMVLDERADGWWGVLTMHEVVLCVRFSFARGFVVLHVQATGIIAYEGVAYRSKAHPSIDIEMSVKCRVDVRNVRAQCPDIYWTDRWLFGHIYDNRSKFEHGMPDSSFCRA